MVSGCPRGWGGGLLQTAETSSHSMLSSVIKLGCPLLLGGPGWMPVLCGQGLFWCSTRLYTIQVFIGSRQYPVPSIVGFKWNTGSGGLGSFLLRGGGGLLSTVDELDQCSRRLTLFTNMGNLNDTGIQSQWPGDSVSAWWRVIINWFNNLKWE